MKENEHKELIERMADVLRGHSAPYKEGAWEHFVAKHGKRRRVIPLWYLSGAAATLIFGVALYLYRGNFDSSIHPTATNFAKRVTEINKSNDTVDGGDSLVVESKKQIPMNDHTNALAVAVPKPLTHKNHIPDETGETVQEINKDFHPTEALASKQADLQESSPAGQDYVVQQKETVQKDHEQLTENRKKDGEESALMQMLQENDSYISSGEESKMHMASQTNSGKWNVGVVLAPSVTGERLNMGGGVAVAYRISNRLSIGSGVSVVDLGLHNSTPFSPSSSGQMNAPVSTDVLSSRSAMLSAKSSETKELVSVNTKLLALDVPIDLKYDLSKQFYVSAGVSFFAVLNEDRVNNYTTTTPTNRTLQNTDGYAFSQPEFQVKSVHEASSETPYQGNSYSGFLNFSVGRKMPVFKKVGLSVEPFIKIPIGELSKQDMNLRYGGVRVITNF
ncbi:hypothetical protein GCM10023231_05940 [Olivibacter ginsenosidimutans]|uniref:PorT family protein n=1 Tax=Olivibacter ginsenosidimutans TaxID=1176537 RepID=A0ABP9AH65_9SPHI